MGLRKSDQNAFAALGELNCDIPPPEQMDNLLKADWDPPLEPVQRELYVCPAAFILGWSEKGSGKTWACVNKLVKHCFKHRNALAAIFVPVKSMANKGGAWDELVNKILPGWKKGCGMVYSKGFDSQKNEMVWIQNRYRGWSQIVLISAPHASQVRDRLPGQALSAAFVDEITTTNSDEYFKAVAAQVGRRSGIPGEEQFFVAACNPKGPSHWVYQKWFVEAIDEDTGARDPDFADFYFPSEQNLKNLPSRYFEKLEKIYKNDPIAYARLLGGEWIDQPSGDALFGDLYNAQLHVRPLTDDGKPHPKQRIMPNGDYPMIIGLDSGSTYHSFSFMQWMPVEDKMRWVVFDEVLLLRRKLTYRIIIPILCRRIRFWRQVSKKSDGTEGLPMVWVSDVSAFNQYRASTGSYDYMEMEKAYEEVRKEYGLEEIKIKPAPQFSGSVAARIRCMQMALAEEAIWFSASCSHHIRMLLLLDSEKQKEGEPFNPELAMKPRRSDHIHVFDSVTYPMLTSSIAPHKLVPHGTDTQKLIAVA